ncbi:hypothetical protein CSV80_11320 [Sporosarcina sp. P12(2017)]|uniref:hypothetical protein n=1 Tax=unclassified Sporosarcina TaxID=2647733 RepID=UPI000C16B3D5|nr:MULTISPECIES: hypothetical protein [unclassified Sporosarcina]PIC57050.1 hypothetical protein CSV81_11720 [Sporosarcina sp. P10]PIC60433.1 hypothetical protein CSV80_11320 [Sporosarcina sp. P12(2017)]
MYKELGNHVAIKEIIFNGKQYSKTKKTLGIFYITLLAYFQATQNYIIGGTLAAIGIIGGIIYIVSKIYIYNEQKNIIDIMFLIIYCVLLVWGIYIIYTL